MLQVLHSAAAPAPDSVLRAMFAARKAVFVDLLRWDVPVIDGCFEVDQFDDAHATYLILTRCDGDHLGSMRLLPTTRPHILDSLFGGLCAAPPLPDPATFEITRFCLDRSLSARARRSVRDALVTRLATHALAAGITTYRAVAELAWARQVEAFGWRSRLLGRPQRVGGTALCALEIAIDDDTPALLAAAGIAADPVPCARCATSLPDGGRP